MDELMKLADTAPSSCDRKGVKIEVIENRHDKEILSGLLVGGVGWIHRANKILLLFANLEAYKAPGEKTFMPYLDAGFQGMTVYMAAEALGLGCCFVNPNIRQENKRFFQTRFGGKDKLFCGALAIGKYE